MNRPLVILILTGVVLIDLVTTVKTVGEICDAGEGDDAGRFVWHGTTDGELRCCLNMTCPIGTYAVLCLEDDPNSTICEACPENTYMDREHDSHSALSCREQKSCKQTGLTIKHNGSASEPRVCECDLFQGYWDPDNKSDPDSCSGPELCGAGTEVNITGMCEPCRKGTYKPENGTQGCIPWQSCEAPGRIISNGTVTSDIHCIRPGHISWMYAGIGVAVVSIFSSLGLIIGLLYCMIKDKREAAGYEKPGEASTSVVEAEADDIPALSKE